MRGSGGTRKIHIVKSASRDCRSRVRRTGVRGAELGLLDLKSRRAVRTWTEWYASNARKDKANANVYDVAKLRMNLNSLPQSGTAV